MIRNLSRAVRRRTSSVRLFSDDSCRDDKKGLVIGAYDGCAKGELRLTQSAVKFDDEVGGRISELIKGSTSGIQLGNAKVFHGVGCEYYAVAVAGVGPEGMGYNEQEIIDECKENVRVAAASGARALQDQGVGLIFVEGFGNPEAAAEGSDLAIWNYQDLKMPEDRDQESRVELWNDPDRDSWGRGIVKAEAQNIARLLEEMPANLMTPAKLATAAIDILCPCGVQVDVRDKMWIETKKMNAFLNMARGSCEPPLLLELSYCGGHQEDKPVLFTGKGVTFDSGGVCLKKCKGMSEYRADMAGAAVIIGVFKAVAQLNLPINLNALIPLCESMPGGMAMKPGDVVLALNGKTIRIADTDNEGRIILADALSYSCNYKPCIVMNVATLTPGIRTALGASSSGVFSTSDSVWSELMKAGAVTGDRVWRFPVWRHFTKRVTELVGIDVSNTGIGKGGDPCLAAAFLMEFAPPVDFVNMDITGVGMKASCYCLPYLRYGLMTGRPTRTLIQFLNQMACPLDKPTDC